MLRAFRRRGLALAAALALFSGGAAIPQGAKIDVDVALVLAVDISFSMDMEEQQLQRDGYTAAINSRDVLDALRLGPHGRIALTYVEWAGTHHREVLVPWMIVDGPESAKAFTNAFNSHPIRRASRTSVSGAIDIGAELIGNMPYQAIRKVIDISGDGPNNNGRPVEHAREDALQKGIIINGLPIMLNRPGGMGWGDIADLDAYYEDCVIGGPGSFVMAIRERGQFVEATRGKLIREVSGLDEVPVIRANSRPRTDCFIGEKQWRQRWGN